MGSTIEEIEDAVPGGDPPDVWCGVDEAALGRHVGDRDQPGPGPDRAFQRGDVNLSGGVIVDDVDLDADDVDLDADRRCICRNPR